MVSCSASSCLFPITVSWKMQCGIEKWYLSLPCDSTAWILMHKVDQIDCASYRQKAVCLWDGEALRQQVPGISAGASVCWSRHFSTRQAYCNEAVLPFARILSVCDRVPYRPVLLIISLCLSWATLCTLLILGFCIFLFTVWGLTCSAVKGTGLDLLFNIDRSAF